MPPLALSVVIPAYNEAARIGATVDAVAGYLGPRCVFDVLVVDDGSTDGTADAAQAAAARHPEACLIRLRSHRGKGAAVREGFLQAEGASVCFIDADLAVPVDEMETLLHVLEAEGCDVGIASRALPASTVVAGPGLVRQALSPVFNALVRALFGLPFHDTQCGFKGFRREAARALAERARIDGFAFDVELLLLADRLGFRIAEFPVRVEHRRSSSVRLMAQAGPILADLWRIRSRLRSGAYRLPPQRPAQDAGAASTAAPAAPGRSTAAP